VAHYALICIHQLPAIANIGPAVLQAWLGAVVVGRWIRRFPAVPPLGATLGKLFTHVPLFTKQYKLVPASAGGKVHHRSGVGYAGTPASFLPVAAVVQRP